MINTPIIPMDHINLYSAYGFSFVKKCFKKILPFIQINLKYQNEATWPISNTK